MKSIRSDPYPAFSRVRSGSDPQHNLERRNGEHIRGARVQVPEGGRSPHTRHHLQPLDQQDQSWNTGPVSTTFMVFVLDGNSACGVHA